MRRMTKIICTLGPACDDIEILNKMYESGMNIARLNMSHGTIQSHQQMANKLQTLREQQSLQLLVDTKGPEMRISTFENGFIELHEGDTFVLTINDIVGNQKKVGLKYKALINEVKVGDKIYANNGMIVLQVVDLTDVDIFCKVIFGGKLSNNKSINVPNLVPSIPYLSEIDKLDIQFAIQNKADYLALSFVSDKQNVLDVKEFLKSNGADNIKIIAKIENAKGVKNAEEIFCIMQGAFSDIASNEKTFNKLTNSAMQHIRPRAAQALAGDFSDTPETVLHNMLHAASSVKGNYKTADERTINRICIKISKNEFK